MGGPELVVVLVIAGPIVAAAWVGRLVHRVYKLQEEMKTQARHHRAGAAAGTPAIERHRAPSVIHRAIGHLAGRWVATEA